MAEIPSVDTTITDQPVAAATGLDVLTVIAPVPLHADATPRIYAGSDGARSFHGYAPGVDYLAIHASETRKPVIFVGIPIETPGVVGSVDDSGVTGTSRVTVAAGPSGALDEIEGVVRVVTGGTVGTNGIVLSVSADGERTTKRVRLKTATSYTFPDLGVTVTFGTGTLVADDVFTFATTAPKGDGDGIAAARAALAAQMKKSRSWLVVGDAANATEVGDVTTEINAFATENKRFSLARVQVRDRLPLGKMSRSRKRMTGSPTLTFAEVGVTGDTITRSVGSWITDGFEQGDTITVDGSVSNDGDYVIASLTATVITLGSEDLTAEGPVADVGVVGSHTITFAEVGLTGDTITRSGGSWLDDGFRADDEITVDGSVSNDGTFTIAGVTATVITLGADDLTPESIQSHAFSIEAAKTFEDWAADLDTDFASVDDQRRIDLGMGKRRKKSPITGWRFRRPVQWAASVREYQHDVQVATYEVDLGSLDGWSGVDAHGNLEEFDDEAHGGGSSGRFTSFRSWDGEDPSYISLSLTRADENSLLSRTHNMHVANVMCSTIQAEGKLSIGKNLVLNPDGTATEAALGRIESAVNTAIALNLLSSGKEGPRASPGTRWVATRGDVLNIPGAHLRGKGTLNLNGTIEHFDTEILVPTGGA